MPGGKHLLLAEFESATAEVEDVTSLQKLGSEVIMHEFAVFHVFDQARHAQNAQVMRNVGDFGVQHVGDVADVLWARLQALNDLEPIRITQYLEQRAHLSDYNLSCMDTFCERTSLSNPVRFSFMLKTFQRLGKAFLRARPILSSFFPLTMPITKISFAL